MRKLVAVELVSFDGVMESPEEWAFGYSDDEMEEANAKGWPPRTRCCWGGPRTKTSPPSGPSSRPARRWWTT